MKASDTSASNALPIYSEPDSVAAIVEAVAPMADRLAVHDLVRPYADLAWPSKASGVEWPNWPTLHLDDPSGIPFLKEVVGIEMYQHRARIRAGDRDLFAAVEPLTPGYERYCREHLAMGAPEFVLAEPEHGAWAVARACAEGAALDHIAGRAREAGGLYFHPYMGIEEAWELARCVSIGAEVSVRVLGPPPPVTWIANDKALLGEIVQRVVGDDWLVETRSSETPDAIARDLALLAGRHERVGLKRTRCASAMGNAVYRAEEVRGRAHAELEADVRRFLDRTEWDGREEVLSVAWEETDLSPSTQLWIPAPGDGLPRVDGVYEQLLEGPEKVFLGSRPSTLPDRVNETLAHASVKVAIALQSMGYVGRCSFDLLVLGDPDGDFEARFTECNGRWGGTSTPMHLVDRLVGHPRPVYRAQDFVHEGLRGAALDDVLAAVGDELFDPRTGRGRYIFYNVGPMARSGKLDVIALGASPEDADEALVVGLPRCLGLG